MLHLVSYEGIFASRISGHAARAKYYSEEYAKTGNEESADWRTRKFNHQSSTYNELGFYDLDNFDVIYDDVGEIYERGSDAFAEEVALQARRTAALRRSRTAANLRETFPLLFKDTIRLCHDCAAKNEEYEPDPDFVAEQMLPCRCGTREYFAECNAFTERLEADIDPEDINDVVYDRSISQGVIWPAYTDGARIVMAKCQRVIDAAVRCGYVQKYSGPYIGSDTEDDCFDNIVPCIDSRFVRRNRLCECELRAERTKYYTLQNEVSRIRDMVHIGSYGEQMYDNVCAVLDDIRAATAAKVATLAYARDRDAFSLALTLGAKLDAAAARDIARAFYP
jgi:hypothetical protein